MFPVGRGDFFWAEIFVFCDGVRLGLRVVGSLVGLSMLLPGDEDKFMGGV